MMMNGCIYAQHIVMRRRITFWWLGNYVAKVSKIHTVEGGGYFGLWHIFDRGFSHVWHFVTEDREGSNLSAYFTASDVVDEISNTKSEDKAQVAKLHNYGLRRTSDTVYGTYMYVLGDLVTFCMLLRWEMSAFSSAISLFIQLNICNSSSCLLSCCCWQLLTSMSVVGCDVASGRMKTTTT